MIIIKFITYFFLIVIVMSLFNIIEGFSETEFNLCLKENKEKIESVKNKVNSDSILLDKAKNEINYWKNKIEEAQKDSKNYTDKISNNEDLIITQPQTDITF